MVKKKTASKVKRGVWYRRVRGSYLPASPEGTLLQLVLLLVALFVVIAAVYDTRDVLTVGVSALLQLVGLGALFTWIAQQKS